MDATNILFKGRNMAIFKLNNSTGCYGMYFLFDKVEKRYKYAKEYEGLTDIKINKEKKLLYSFSDSGGGYWWAGTYKLIRN